MFLLFLAPFSWGTRYARGRCSQSEWVLYGRDPTCAVWEEPGKQNPRSCRAQELARAVPRKRSGRKRSLTRLSENWLKVRTRVINDSGKTGESLPLTVLHL